MDKEKRNLIITIALIISLFFLIGKNFLSKKKPVNSVASAGNTQTMLAGSVSVLNQIKQNQTIWDAQQSRWDKEEWGRDPFRSEGSQVGKFSDVPLNLTGIVWDQKMPFAAVNDKVLKKGDMIEGYKVVEIKPSSVVFSSGEETIELQLFQANQPSNTT